MRKQSGDCVRTLSFLTSFFLSWLKDGACLLLALIAGCARGWFTALIPPADATSVIGSEPALAVKPDGGTFRGGAALVEITPAVGVPLAGWGQVSRRNSLPDLDPRNAFTLFKPSIGVKDPLFARALVLSDGQTTVALLTLDDIATDREVVNLRCQDQFMASENSS